jgi:hypothetical protein
MDENVLRLCYFSASRLTSDWDVACLADQSRFHNARSGITGILLYEEGAFSQVLEGKPETVQALLAKIEADPRHSYVTELYRIETKGRLFTPWPMAFIGREQFAQADQWPHKEMLDALKIAYGEAGDPDGRHLLESFFLRTTSGDLRLPRRLG